MAERFATGRAGYGTLVLRGLKAGAVCLVILVGIALLTGYMASEQLGFFSNKTASWRADAACGKCASLR